MKFTKMHGIGNDYIYLYEENQVDLSTFAVEYAKYHSGIGSDGVIHIKKGGNIEGISCDFTMEMYNADGSMGKMCGNGIRCLGKYVFDKGYTSKKEISVATASGLRKLSLHLGEKGYVERVTVNMGKASEFQEKTVVIEGKKITGTFVSVGNPHFVVPWENNTLPTTEEVAFFGSRMEKNKDLNPEGVNVEFYTLTQDGFSFRVWERGSGETMACGTGACACFAVINGKNPQKIPEKMTAHLLGGDLILWEDEKDIFMDGNAVTVFEGEI